VTLVTPVEDKRLHMESELRNRIQMLLAGRGAEQLYFHEVSSGAGQDLQEASKIALSMVGALGMGPNGSLLSLQAVRDAHIEFDSGESIRAADTCSSSSTVNAWPCCSGSSRRWMRSLTNCWPRKPCRVRRSSPPSSACPSIITRPASARSSAMP
jgi:hypothetical protein